MSYQVVFEFSPLYELVNSLELFLNKKSLKNVELGSEWINDVQAKLEASNIDLGNSKDIPDFTYLYLLIWQSPEKENIDLFLQWLKSLQPGSLYEKLFSYISETLPADLAAVRDKYVELIDKWNQIYFSKLDSEIIDCLRQSVIDSDRSTGVEDPVLFVDQISGGLKIEAYEGLRQVILTPTYHTNPLITIRKLKNIAHILYPVDLPETDSTQPSNKLIRLTKALADENRLKMIKLLGEGPKTFTEILQHFTISKSTVHHHVMLLRTAGLISSYHTDECCSEMFIYRPFGIHELVTHFDDYLQK
jgi:DNA-binding transcriptional ArsR family regulator